MKQVQALALALALASVLVLARCWQTGWAHWTLVQPPRPQQAVAALHPETPKHQRGHRNPSLHRGRLRWKRTGWAAAHRIRRWLWYQQRPLRRPCLPLTQLVSPLPWLHHPSKHRHRQPTPWMRRGWCSCWMRRLTRKQTGWWPCWMPSTQEQHRRRHWQLSCYCPGPLTQMGSVHCPKPLGWRVWLALRAAMVHLFPPWAVRGIGSLLPWVAAAVVQLLDCLTLSRIAGHQQWRHRHCHRQGT